MPATLIMYGIIAIALAGAFGGAYLGVRNHFYAARDAEWTPRWNSLKTQSDAEHQAAQTALDANARLAGQIPEIQAKCDKAAADVADIQKLANGQMAAAKDAIARAQAALKNKQAELEDAKRRAATATPGDRATQCSAAETDLRALARSARAP